MSTANGITRPKLRPIDAHAISRDGRPALLLRDPLQLAEKIAIIPQQLAPILLLCDGTRDVSGLRAALALRFGLRVEMDTLERIIAALDEALLLDNERFAQARQQALVGYRQAPHRLPVLAGQSYPAEADELRSMLQSFYRGADAASPPLSACRGLISPHIDFTRGGPAYARVWQCAAEAVRAADQVVLLGTDHYSEAGTLTLTRQHYVTPFGVLPTAQDVVDHLAQAIGEEQAFADELHHRSEHSIELAAVWLHHVRRGQPCKLVPILCGSFGRFMHGAAGPESDPAIQALIAALEPVLSDCPTVVVAAADLAHSGPAFGGAPQYLPERARLRAADDALLERICAGDAEGFFLTIKQASDRYNVCGLPPIYTALRLLGPTTGEQVAYEHCPADEQGTSLVSICGVVFQ